MRRRFHGPGLRQLPKKARTRPLRRADLVCATKRVASTIKESSTSHRAHQWTHVLGAVVAKPHSSLVCELELLILLDRFDVRPPKRPTKHLSRCLELKAFNGIPPNRLFLVVGRAGIEPAPAGLKVGTSEAALLVVAISLVLQTTKKST